MRNPMADQTLDPEADGGGKHCEGGDRDLAGPLTAAPGAGPGGEGQDGAGSANLIAKVEVVGLGVVEVDGAFDQAETEDAGVEVQVVLRVAGDGGDVVNAQDGGGHAR